MSKRLYLHVPISDELWYRQKIMSDPDTMSYNKGYEEFEGYDKATGCIDFLKNEWKKWFDYFVGQEPDRYYAYIVRLEDNAFIGDVNVHKVSYAEYYEMGIVLEAKYRGKSYAMEALTLLLEYAFEKMNVKAVHNIFEDVRDAAVRTHLSAGFTEYKQENGMLELMITKEQFEQRRLDGYQQGL